MVAEKHAFAFAGAIKLKFGTLTCPFSEYNILKGHLNPFSGCEVTSFSNVPMNKKHPVDENSDICDHLARNSNRVFKKVQERTSPSFSKISEWADDIGNRLVLAS